jgi:hypothetical protein
MKTTRKAPALKLTGDQRDAARAILGHVRRETDLQPQATRQHLNREFPSDFESRRRHRRRFRQGVSCPLLFSREGRLTLRVLMCRRWHLLWKGSRSSEVPNKFLTHEPIAASE